MFHIKAEFEIIATESTHSLDEELHLSFDKNRCHVSSDNAESTVALTPRLCLKCILGQEM